MRIVLSGKPEGDRKIPLNSVINEQYDTGHTGFWRLKMGLSGGLF